MSSERKSWLAGVEAILRAKTHDLKALAELADLDPATMYIGTRMDGADLRGQDLRGMTFTHLDRSKVQIDNKTRLDDTTPVEEPTGLRHALVLFLDRELELAYWASKDQLPLPVTPFGTDHAHAFWQACKGWSGPKLILQRAKDGQHEPSVLQLTGEERNTLVLLAADGQPTKFRRIIKHADDIPLPTILTPLPAEFGGRRRSTRLPAVLRDLITLVIIEWDRLFRDARRAGLMVYLSARSEHRLDPASAWYQLYARALKLGLDGWAGERALLHDTDEMLLTSRQLWPRLEEMHVPKIGGWPNYDAGLFLAGGGHVDGVPEGDYQARVYDLLLARGVQLSHALELGRTASGSRTDFFIIGSDFDIEVEVRVGPGGRAVLGQAASLPIRAAKGLLVSEYADAGAVLGALGADGRLLVNLQDLRWYDGLSPSLWIMVGHQARRMARAMNSSATSLYFASLIETAVSMGRVGHFDDYLILRGWSPGRGSLQIDVGVRSYDTTTILLEVTISKPRGPALTKFMLGFDQDGPFLSRR